MPHKIVRDYEGGTNWHSRLSYCQFSLTKLSATIYWNSLLVDLRRICYRHIVIAMPKICWIKLGMDGCMVAR
ncbi:hypothetical protein SNE40_020689 [Patella caerulea]|uniref:Uncharacterized protein n=1 Tax=Patella caerulea TaxID=87958 RepID=A0AAN8P7P0_PATCE